MDRVPIGIGEAMGWFVERAAQRQRNLKTDGTIAALAWKTKPKGSLGSEEALANRLRRLDKKGEGAEWWLGPKGKPYLHAVAAVLKVEPSELTTWIEAARPTDDDEARWFRFEVFPGLCPLNLDDEHPYPGVPTALWRGDGPRGPTWWHAPPGAGRTLVGRWLARRHGWSLVSSLHDAPERSFIEYDGANLPELRLPDRVIVASPHPMPQALHERRWEEIRGEAGWEHALLDWVNDRLVPDRRFDPTHARRAIAEGKLSTSTPGALLEALAELTVLGPALLEAGVPPGRALDAWAQASAGRVDRPVRPASRDWLREHGGWLLPQIELQRMLQGLPVSADSVLRCMPELPHASADTIREARDAGDIDKALSLLDPSPSDLVAAMSALRWLLPGEWGLPSRVVAHLRAVVVELVLDGPAELRSLGALLDTREIAAEVIIGLANSTRLKTWTERLAAGDPADPKTALAADGLLKAFVLLAERRLMPMDGLAHDLAAALRAVYGEACPDLVVEARVEEAETWTSVAWLTLLRHGAFPEPGSDRSSVWAWQARQALRWRDVPKGSSREKIRGLAADTLGALTHTDRRWAGGPLAAVVALAHHKDPERGALHELAQVGPLEVVERLFAPWAASTEEVCGLLWPVWTEFGIPDEEEKDKLAKVWATYPGGAPKGRLADQLERHAASGVALPDRVWPIVIETAPRNAEVLARAPIDTLLAADPKLRHTITPAVWARAPERALAVIAERLAGELTLESAAWFVAIPGARALDVLAVVRAGARDEAALKVRQWWADRAIRERVPGWERVWAWARGVV